MKFRELFFTILLLVNLLLQFSFSIIGQKKKTRKPYIKSIKYQFAKHKSNRTPEQLHLVPNINFKLYIISHDAHSMEIAKNWSYCMPFVDHILIDSSPFFESWVYATILSQPSIQSTWENLDFIGLATYKSLKFVTLEKMTVTPIYYLSYIFTLS